MKIESVEPPNWWIGFESQEFSVLIHAKEISGCQFKVAQKGLKIKEVLKPGNPDYVVLKLQILPETPAGMYPIEMYNKGGLVASIAFPLLEQSPTHQRKEISPGDALYRIHIDRFVNKNSRNDSLVTDFKSDEGKSYGGDLAGVISALDYLFTMGFTGISLMNPLGHPTLVNHQNDGNADFYSIHKSYGMNDDLSNCVEMAKSMGLKTIIELNVQEIHKSHEWVKSPPGIGWLIKTSDRDEINNYQLNLENDHLASYVGQNIMWWFQFSGCDGIHLLNNKSDDLPGLLFEMQKTHYKQIASNVSFENSENLKYLILGGDTSIKMKYIDQFTIPLFEKCTKDLINLSLLHENLLYKTFNLSNAQFIRTETAKEIGLFETLGRNYDFYKMAMIFLCTTKQIPVFRYGSEIAMSSEMAFSKFPNGDTESFKDGFTGVGLTNTEHDCHFFMQNLLNWRRNNEIIQAGELQPLYQENGILIYSIHLESRILLVIFNFNRYASSVSTDRIEKIKDTPHAIDVLENKRVYLFSNLMIEGNTAKIFEINLND